MRADRQLTPAPRPSAAQRVPFQREISEPPIPHLLSQTVALRVPPKARPAGDGGVLPRTNFVPSQYPSNGGGRITAPPPLEVSVSQAHPPRRSSCGLIGPRSQTAVNRDSQAAPVQPQTEPAMFATQTSPPSPPPMATRRPARTLRSLHALPSQCTTVPP